MLLMHNSLHGWWRALLVMKSAYTVLNNIMATLPWFITHVARSLVFLYLVSLICLTASVVSRGASFAHRHSIHHEISINTTLLIINTSTEHAKVRLQWFQQLINNVTAGNRIVTERIMGSL
jgi:hypothetical protein